MTTLIIIDIPAALAVLLVIGLLYLLLKDPKND